MSNEMCRCVLRLVNYLLQGVCQKQCADVCFVLLIFSYWLLFPLHVCQNNNVHTCNSVCYSDVNVGIPTISKQHVLLQRPKIETHSFLNDVLLFKSVSFPLFVYVFVLFVCCCLLLFLLLLLLLLSHTFYSVLINFLHCHKANTHICYN